MTALRDGARRTARGLFASQRPDGTPVGSHVITYQDGCVEAFDGDGQGLGGIFGGPDHVPGSHTRENWWIYGPYRLDSLDYDPADDFGDLYP